MTERALAYSSKSDGGKSTRRLAIEINLVRPHWQEPYSTKSDIESNRLARRHDGLAGCDISTPLFFIYEVSIVFTLPRECSL
jgi:hypothetical protein